MQISHLEAALQSLFLKVKIFSWTLDNVQVTYPFSWLNDLAFLQLGSALWLSQNPPASTGDTGDVGSIPRSGRSPVGENGNSVQYSCLESPMDRGARPATVHEITKSQTRLKGFRSHRCVQNTLSLATTDLLGQTHPHLQKPGLREEGSGRCG